MASGELGMGGFSCHLSDVSFGKTRVGHPERFVVSFRNFPSIMFRLPGADRSPDKAAVEEERRRAKQNVWFTMKAFVAYVVLLRLGKVTFYVMQELTP